MTLERVSAIWLLLLAAAPARAETPAPLEEVVVTADLRPLPVSRRPGGATVIAAGGIQDSVVVHLEELLPQVPSLSWAGASSRPRYFLLRGVGELEQYQGAPNPSVGFLVDEIDFSAIGMIATLFDVEQVEVLRGPQGTRYGANALGGLIKLKTREPEARRSFDAEAGFGGDGLWTAGAAAGGPLPKTEGSTWRAVLHRAVSNGFRDNRFLGRNDTNGRDETQARLRIRVAGAGRWQADLGLLHADFDNGYDAFAIDNSFDTLSNRPGRDAQRSDGAFLDFAGGTADGIALRSITTWAESDIVTSFDGDWGNDQAWGDAGPYDFFSQTQRRRRVLSQDLRLSAARDDWSWLVGAWGSELAEDNRVNDDGRYLEDAFVAELDSRYRATSSALYGRLEWQPRDDTTLAAGLRLEQRDARYRDSAGVAFDPDDSLWGGELSATRRLSAAHSVWAVVARGFRAGGFNIGPSVPAGRAEFEPEYLWSAEAGWRARNAAGDRSGNVNLFYARREHQQVATSLQLDPENPLTFLFLTENAARGESWGLEASAAWQASPTLSLDAMVSGMESRFIGYFNGERDLSGRAFAHAPEWKAALGATWRHAAGWMARLDLSGEAGFYFDTSHDQRGDARFLANLRAGYEAERWSAQVWVRNLFDERYPVRGFFFENEPPDFPTRLYLRWGDPRQAGVTLRYAF